MTEMVVSSKSVWTHLGRREGGMLSTAIFPSVDRNRWVGMLSKWMPSKKKTIYCCQWLSSTNPEA